MHYLTELQLKELIKHGFVPTEDTTTLTEAAQWLWSKYIICIDFIVLSKTRCRSYIAADGKDINKDFKNIPEALSWAIDEAIKQLND